jgi:hypothetical protein
MLLQESGAIEWDPRTSEPPGPFSLIMTGNLAAGLISDAVRPNAGFIGRRQSWDPVWFFLYEVISFPCWYLVGATVDRGHSRLGKLMLVYLVTRFALAGARMYDVGWRLQVFCWMVLAFSLVSIGIARLVGNGARGLWRYFHRKQSHD